MGHANKFARPMLFKKTALKGSPAKLWLAKCLLSLSSASLARCCYHFPVLKDNNLRYTEVPNSAVLMFY